MYDKPLPQQGAALVAWWLAHGEALTTNQAARLLRVDRRRAWRIMITLARVLPVARRYGGWQRIPGLPQSRAVTPTQRAALLAWHFAGGALLTTAQAAALTGLHRRAAYHLLCSLSSAIPIYDEAGAGGSVWQVGAGREAC